MALRRCCAWLLLAVVFLAVPSEQQTFPTQWNNTVILEVPTWEQRTAKMAMLINSMARHAKTIIVADDERMAALYSSQIKNLTRASVGVSVDKSKVPNSTARRKDVLILSAESLALSLKDKLINLRNISLIAVDEDVLKQDSWKTAKEFLSEHSATQLVVFTSDMSVIDVHVLSGLREQPVFERGLQGNQIGVQSHLLLSSELARNLDLTSPLEFARTTLGGYKFQDPTLLTKAFLHATYKIKERKGKKESYQPLDYVGDFVLDYIVSKYILQNAANKTQAYMAEKKTAMLKQESLAFLAAKHKFHLHVFVDGANEKSSLNNYVRSVERVKTLLELNTLPRKRSFLYKFFKSVAGAIYIDSACNLERVEAIYMKFMKNDLDALLASR
ncbi:uncharacterized protein LOC135399026 [Ornithodoros turicata]|uniref:uncharacterized protein LOC135399026 n=1 Tax=Ornithodoros turicata TaxID=34597 RepID=UPI00313996D3